MMSNGKTVQEKDLQGAANKRFAEKKLLWGATGPKRFLEGVQQFDGLDGPTEIKKTLRRYQISTMAAMVSRVEEGFYYDRDNAVIAIAYSRQNLAIPS